MRRTREQTGNPGFGVLGFGHSRVRPFSRSIIFVNENVHFWHSCRIWCPLSEKHISERLFSEKKCAKDNGETIFALTLTFRPYPHQGKFFRWIAFRSFFFAENFRSKAFRSFATGPLVAWLRVINKSMYRDRELPDSAIFVTWLKVRNNIGCGVGASTQLRPDLHRWKAGKILIP
jgi:hypothetical protein